MLILFYINSLNIILSAVMLHVYCIYAAYFRYQVDLHQILKLHLITKPRTPTYLTCCILLPPISEFNNP